jgi:hypothetical protein
MSTIPIFLLAWLVQAIAAAVVLTPVLFLARERVHWQSWELLSVVIPFCIWVLLFLCTNSKSLANLIIEPGILGLMLGVAALARVGMSRRIPEEKAGLVALFGMWVVAGLIFLAVPYLEE